MSAPIGNANIRINADADDFPRELQSAIEDALTAVLRSVTSTFDQIEAEAGSAGAGAGDALSDGLEAGARSAADSIGSIDDQATASAEATSRAFRGAGNAIADAASAAASSASGSLGSIDDNSRGAAEGAARGWRGAASSIADAVAGAASSARSALGSIADASRGAVESVESGISRALDSPAIRNTAKTVGLAVGGVFAGSLALGMGRLTAIDTAEGKLRGLGHSAEGVAGIMDSALAAVKGTAFGLGEAATIAASAVAAGVQPGEELTRYLSLTADAAAIAGVSLDEMGAIINKTTATGKVYTENLNQLAERGIPIFQWLADEYGVTQEALSDMVAAGQVDAATFRKVIEDNIGGAAQQMGTTFMGALSNLKAAMGRFGEAFLAPFFDSMKGGLGQITDVFNTLTTAIGPIADQIGVALVPVFDQLGRAAVDFVNSFIEGGGLQRLGDLLVSIAPALGELALALAELAVNVGMAAFEVFAATLTALEPVLTGLVIPALEVLARLIADNTWAVEALMWAYIAIKAIIIADTIATTANSIAKGIAAARTYSSTVALGTDTVAITAHTVATKIASAATTVFGGALALLSSPITWIVIAIGAVVAALVWFFTQTELGKTIVANAWAFIQEAIRVAWEFIQQVFAWFGQAWDWIAEKAMWFWQAVIIPVWDGIVAAVQFAWEILSLIFRLIQASFEVVGHAFWLVWDTIIRPVFEFWANAANWLWNNVLRPVGEYIAAGWRMVGDTLAWVWSVVIQPVIGALGAAWNWLWDSVIRPVSDWIGARIHEIGGIFGAFGDRVRGVVDFIGGQLRRLWDWFGNLTGTILRTLGNAGSVLWNWGRDLIQGLLNGATSLLSRIGEFFLNAVPDWIKEPFKEALGIASPSTVFMAFGMSLGEGLIAGTQSMTEQVRQASQDMADAAAEVTVPQIGGGGGISANWLPHLAPDARGGTGAGAAAGTGGGGGGGGGAAGGAEATEALAGMQANLTALGQQFPAVASEVVDPAMAQMGTTIATTAHEIIDPAVLGMTGNLNAYAATFPLVTNNVITPSMAAMGTNIVAIKDAMIDPAMWGMQANTMQTGHILADQVTNVINPFWSWMGNHVMAVKTGTIDPAFAGIQGGLHTVTGSFQVAVDSIRAIWDQMRGAVSAPVRFSIDQVFNNGLVGMWNSVAKMIGVDEMKPYIVGGFASGAHSVLPGYSPGRDDLEFLTRDGRVGISLSGGEAIMRPEFTRAVGPDAVDGINAAAKMGGVEGVRRHLGGFAGGGIIGSIVGLVNRYFPGMTITSTTRNSNDYHGQGKAVDFSNGGDAGTPQMKAAAKFFFDNYAAGLLELIHWPLAGWQNIKNGRPLDYGAATNAQHRNHVHVAAPAPLPEPGFPIAPISSGAGGMPVFDPAEYVRSAFAPKRREIESALDQAHFAGMVGQIPRKVYETMGTAMEKKAISEAEKMLVFADPGGEGVERWRPLVEQLLTRYNLGLENTNRTLRRMNQESGGNPRAINLWDSNAAKGTPSKGLMQVIDPTFQAYRDPMLSPDIWDPAANVASSMRYALARYGSLAAAYDRAGGYDLGGMATGKGLMFKDVIPPERVLSERQTVAFEKLVDGLRLAGDGAQIGTLRVGAGGELLRVDGPQQGTTVTASGRVTTVLVSQYIQGGEPKQVADEVSNRLLSLLPG